MRAGDSLKSIALATWGDADMCYLIAQANNLTGNESLVQGQLLQIPNKVTNIHNNASTFRPYNPGEVIGHIDPSLPAAPPPAHGGCGGLGTILMVIVAIVVTIYTAGAAAELLAATTGTALTGSVASVGLSVLGGTVSGLTAGAAVAAAAIGGAVGSIASQLVGQATGATSGFSWKQVAFSAVGSAITAGVGEGLNALATTPGSMAGGIVANPYEKAIVQATAASAVAQGKWSWREIAASAVSAGAGQAAGAAVASAQGAALGATGTDGLYQRLASGLGSAWSQGEVLSTDPRYSKARTGSMFISSLGSALVDGLAQDPPPATTPADDARELARFKMLGNALGESLASASTSPPQPRVDEPPVAPITDAPPTPSLLPIDVNGLLPGQVNVATDVDPRADARETNREAMGLNLDAGHVVTIGQGGTLSGAINSSRPNLLGNVMAANGMTSSRVFPGQNILVPDDPTLYGDQSALGQGVLNRDNAHLQVIAVARAVAAANAANAGWDDNSPVSLQFPTPIPGVVAQAPAPQILDLQYDEASYFAGEPSGPTQLLTQAAESINLGTRIAGLAQAAGGVSEGLLGSSLFVAGAATSGTGVGILGMAGGTVLVGGGSDNIQTGWRTFLSGQSQQTLFNQGLQGLGATPQEAALIDGGLNGLGSIGAGSWLQAMSAVPAYAPAAFLEGEASVGNVEGAASGRPIFPGDPDFIGPLQPNPAHNAAAFAQYQNVLGTTEAANPLVDSLNATGGLPSNYVTKQQAAAAGWSPGKALNNYVPGGQLGGDEFLNTTGVLPSETGRTWYEADVGLDSTMSRAKQPGTRLLYSNDGLLYVTTDHYTTVNPIGTWTPGKP